MKENILSQLRRGFVSSCQPVDGSPMDTPEIIAAMAKASEDGGAAGLRIEGIANLKAVVKVVSIPIIGIVKRDLTDFPIRITPYLTDVVDLAKAGASIIAFDGTDRARPDNIKNIIDTIHHHGCIAMADCSTVEEALACSELGADIIGTTLSGYCGEYTPIEPDFEFVETISKMDMFVMAEGRYNSPILAEKAILSGADCVTIGSAITRIEHICDWFNRSVNNARLLKV
ncbi:N-acetylmannosamine-6-phosphate 2-epimerase [Vibrio ponticus]|nr:N-acetylmannosamine-6-phosphate 2-epimerase [Vibrio ponticus]ROV60379.1 N-acetylmannosamine-6-phosphate 2-epimerase [Vibrio ponticus]